MLEFEIVTGTSHFSNSPQHNMNVEQLQFEFYHLGDNTFFDPILMCPLCSGLMCDRCCIHCGASPQYTYTLSENGEDTSDLWPLPELKPSYFWDEHGLDCDCPNCSDPNLFMQEYSSQLNCDAGTSDINELACDETMDDWPVEAIPPT